MPSRSAACRPWEWVISRSQSFVLRQLFQILQIADQHLVGRERAPAPAIASSSPRRVTLRAHLMQRTARGRTADPAPRRSRACGRRYGNARRASHRPAGRAGADISAGTGRPLISLRNMMKSSLGASPHSRSNSRNGMPVFFSIASAARRICAPMAIVQAAWPIVATSSTPMPPIVVGTNSSGICPSSEPARSGQERRLAARNPR